jgi:hypothetical protein
MKRTHDEELVALKRKIQLLEDEKTAYTAGKKSLMPQPSPSPARPSAFTSAFSTRNKRM